MAADHSDSTIQGENLMSGGKLCAALCLAAAMGHLQSAAGPAMQAVSVTVDLGSADPSGSLIVTTTIEKQTRSLAFLSLRATAPNGEQVFAVRALFATAGTHGT